MFSQYLAHQPWPRGRSRSRRGPQGQHLAARARVGRRALEPLRPECSPLCVSALLTPTCPLTAAPTHLPSQYPGQRRRRQGRLRARCHPQGDDDLQPRVRRCTPKWLLFCQPPLTRTCSLTVPPHPSLAVSGTTTSETRAPPLSRPSSRRRRSPISSAPPPLRVR